MLSTWAHYLKCKVVLQLHKSLHGLHQCRKEERKPDVSGILSQGCEGCYGTWDCTPRTRIPTNEIGEIITLKGVWQQVVKDVAYQYLDLTI